MGNHSPDCDHCAAELRYEPHHPTCPVRLYNEALREYLQREVEFIERVTTRLRSELEREAWAATARFRAMYPPPQPPEAPAPPHTESQKEGR